MKALGILFSNIHDDELKELTNFRTTASVPFGGRYRLVDFTLSNFVNADIFNIAIITKTNYHSLMDHVETGRSWDLNWKTGNISIFPPYATNSLQSVYRGKLEALISIKRYLEDSREEYVVLSDSNLICSLNFKDILKKHEETDADITVVYYANQSIREHDLVLKIDNHIVTDVSVALRKRKQPSFISLGVYVMKKEFLLNIIEDAYGHGLIHFEKEYLPMNLGEISIWGYEHKGYTAIIKSIDDYYKANMDLLNLKVREELFYTDNVYTKVKDLSPAKYGVNAKVRNSLIADGTIIDGTVENSIIFQGVHIGKGASVRNSIVMQSSIIESGAMLDYIITDKNVTVTESRILCGVLNYPLVIVKERTV